MSIPDAVLESVKKLSPENQQRVLEFIRSLPKAAAPNVARKDPRGMFSHRGVHITAEEIDEARREVWANFPREFPPIEEK